MFTSGSRPVPQKGGEMAVKRHVFSPLAHTSTLGNKLLLLGLPERKGCDRRDISFCASADGLMFNRKPRGHN